MKRVLKTIKPMKPMTKEEYEKYVEDTHNNAYEKGKLLLQLYQLNDAKPSKYKH